MKSKKNKQVKLRHKIITTITKAITWPFVKIKYNFHYENKYRIKKNEQFLIISNHVTDFDPAFIGFGFNKPLYYVSTDTLTSSKFYKIVDYALNPIPKKKAQLDVQCVKKILETKNEGGSICLFPEGNRSYGEFQFPIELSLVKLIKKLKIPIILYNIKGGYGKSPRFAHTLRRGKITCSIKEMIYPKDYLNISDSDLLNHIVDSIRVYDSDSNILYKSKRRAEYLERELFVCPICKESSSLISKGSMIGCTKCGFESEYTNDLHFKSDNKDFTFKRMVDWYNFQKKWILNYTLDESKTIFTDENVKIYQSDAFSKRKLLSKGKMVLGVETLSIGNINFNIKDIFVASPISSIKLSITINNHSYLIKGDKRFNPLKYVLMFNKLDTLMKQNKNDVYYSLD